MIETATMMPTTISPMLAAASRTIAPTAAEAVTKLQSSGLWTFEMKWDGARVLAFITGGKVRLRSRLDNDITYRYPEVVCALEDVYADTEHAILDGEVVVFGPDGLPSWPLSHKRDAQATAKAAAALVASMPARFMAFDVLWLGNLDLRKTAYQERQRYLAREAEQFNRHPSTLCYAPPSDDGEALWRFVLEHSLEGLVAKKKSSTYRAGRGHAWVKLKPTRTLSALVKGHKPGDGWGALELALVTGTSSHAVGSLVNIGHVGSGLTPKHLQEINRRVAAGATYIVAEVEYMEVSPSGQLRQPVFKGFRSDVPLTDCNITQLET